MVNRSDSRQQNEVAILGAGPAGLVVGRWLKERGVPFVIFEAAADLGGQWNPEHPETATWPGMRTNTSRVMTSFSDLSYPHETATYPSREEVHAYLHRYAELFALHGHIRFDATITHVSRANEGFELTVERHGSSETARYSRLIVATGRQRVGAIPAIEGLDGFCGTGGVHHTAAFEGASSFRGRRVLVAGCSISALEIASDLANAGVDTTVCYRRQRYVLPKLLAGVPTDHVMFTRAACRAEETLPPDAAAAGLKAKVLSHAGRPDQWGAQMADPNILSAGITQSQGFLPAVAEGRIATRPWIDRVAGNSINFTDGSADSFDAILFGTGYRHALPFFDAETQRLLGLDEGRLELAHATFHPELPNVAFVGQYSLIGPFFPVVEQQARWVADLFSRPVRADERDRHRAAFSETVSVPPSVPMHLMAIAFARLAGSEPDPEAWPSLKRALLFGPLTATSFRLSGPEAIPDAEALVARDAAAFGAIETPVFTEDEAGLVAVLSASADRADAAIDAPAAASAG